MLTRHSGARAKPASPESITTASHYGFRPSPLSRLGRNDKLNGLIFLAKKMDAQGASAFTRTTRPDRFASNRLIVSADLAMRAQHAVDGLEHVAHARLRYRALHNDDELRLVGGGAHQSPRAVRDGDAHAIHRDEIANFFSRHLLTARFRLLKVFHDLLDHLVFHLIRAVRRHRRRGPGLGQRVLEIGHAFSRIAVEHVAYRKCKEEPVVIAAAERLIEEEVAGLLEARHCANLVDAALDVGMAGLPIISLGAMRAQH